MKQYVVDAFTDKIFYGNPAAVCVMEKWIDDFTLQKIAVKTIYPKQPLRLRKMTNIISAGLHREERLSSAVM